MNRILGWGALIVTICGLAYLGNWWYRKYVLLEDVQKSVDHLSDRMRFGTECETVLIDYLREKHLRRSGQYKEADELLLRSREKRPAEISEADEEYIRDVLGPRSSIDPNGCINWGIRKADSISAQATQ